MGSQVKFDLKYYFLFCNWTLFAQGLRAYQRGLRAYQRGLRACLEGLRARGDGRSDIRTDVQTYGISPNYTGLYPLFEPLAKKGERRVLYCNLLTVHYL